MTSTLLPSSSLQTRKPYPYQPAVRQNSARHAQPSVLFAGGRSGQDQEIFEHTSAPLLHEEQGEKPIIGTMPRKNTPEESANAKASFQRAKHALEASRYLNKNTKLNHALASNIKLPPEFTLAIRFSPNPTGAANHAYFRSGNAAFNQVLQVVNNRINRDEVFTADTSNREELLRIKQAHLPKREELSGEALQDWVKMQLRQWKEAELFEQKETMSAEKLQEWVDSEAQIWNWSQELKLQEKDRRVQFRLPEKELQAKLAQIRREGGIKQQALTTALRTTPATDYTMKLFANPTNGVEEVYKKLLHTYGEGIYPILDTALKADRSAFTEKSGKGKVGPLTQLDSLMGQEFTFDATMPAQLKEFLHNQLGFGQNQLLKDHPQEQALIRNWRIKSAARYAMDRASTINSTWAEWGLSAGISTLWSFALDIVGKNFALASLLKRQLDKTDYNHLPGWQKALLGPPEKLYEPIIEAASPGKKTAAVAIGLMGQASAEVPDVLLVQGAIKNSDGAEGGETLTKWQRFKKAGSGFMWAVKNKKMDTGLAVVSAAIGTSFEKVKELVWVPKSVGAKIGSALTGYVTNGVSVLACGLPFFTEGGPQRSKAGRILAKTYHPVTGTLKLPDAERVALISNGTVKGVQEFFERKAGEKLLHLSPTSRIVAASVPVALGVSILPSTINAITTFLPEGLGSEIAKTGISWLQVPLFGPIELLAMNIVAKWNKSNPQRVTSLSKIGRPVINAVHAPFSMITKGVKGTYSYAKTGKWTPPYQEYQEFLNAIRPIEV